MDLRLNTRRCWAHDSGKSGSVWRVEIQHAMVLLSQRADESCREEVMTVRRAESYRPLSGIPTAISSGSVSRKAATSELKPEG